MGVYIKSGQGMNRQWVMLIDALETYDTLPKYIKMFENCLSPCLDDPLWDMEAYKRHAKKHPLPKDPGEQMDYDEYRSWVTFFEHVLRSANKLGSINDSEDLMDTTAIEEFMREVEVYG